MERIQLYQKDTVKIQGGVFTEEGLPVDLSDKIIGILIIDERQNDKQVKVADITIDGNNFECELTSEITAKLYGNYMIQISVKKDDFSVREIKRFINVQKSF